MSGSGTPPGSARYWLNRALFDLGDPASRKAFADDRAGYFARYPLDAGARAALETPDWRSLLDRGALPNLVFKYFMMHGLPPERFAAIAGETDSHG